MAAALVKRDPSLTGVLENKGLTPLLIAARYISGNELVWHLTLTTADGNPDRPFTGSLAADLVHMLIAGGYLGKRSYCGYGQRLIIGTLPYCS